LRGRGEGLEGVAALDRLTEADDLPYGSVASKLYASWTMVIRECLAEVSLMEVTVILVLHLDHGGGGGCAGSQGPSAIETKHLEEATLA